MVQIKSFRAYRPSEANAPQVAELPYDVMDSDEARELVKENPISFLHVDKAEVDLPLDTDIHSAAVYRKAKENLSRFIDEGVLVQDAKESVYIYTQTRLGKTQVGLVATFAVNDYMDNKIKKHEYTVQVKEIDRIVHVKTTSAHTGPIFLTYEGHQPLQLILDDWMGSHASIFDFISDDGVEHRGYQVDDQNVLAAIKGCFNEIPALYIADGHHRAASAVAVCKELRFENRGVSRSEEYDFFLGVAFPKDQLTIIDYNRVVKDKNGWSTNELLDKIEEKFSVNKKGALYKPQSINEFSLYIDGVWYRLTVKKPYASREKLEENLDVSLLQDYILGPLLGIDDPRRSDRIEFIGGIRGLEEIEKKTDQYKGVGFALYPTTIEQLIAIADDNKVMPPKSTWFEPKLRSGLFIHRF